MAEDLGWKEIRWEIMNSPLGWRLTWNGVGHMASNVWMMRRKGGNHVDYEGRRVNDTRQQESRSYAG
jgi:hypothetical protein